MSMTNDLALQLKTKIEDTAHEHLTKNPLFTQAARGLLTKRHIGLYLHSLEFLLANASVHIGLAQVQSEIFGYSELARFFEKRLPEELGHDQWAASDKKTLNLNGNDLDSLAICPAMLEMNTFVVESIRRDPAYYLVYSLFAEYFTVLAAPSWVNDLEHKCGIDPIHLTVVTKHAELDKDHVKDEIEALEHLLVPSDRWDLPRLKACIDTAGVLFMKFGHQVVGDFADDQSQSRRVDDTLSFAQGLGIS